MDNSVIISSIGQRIEYYATAAGVTSSVEKNEYKKKISSLEKEITYPQLLDIERKFESFNLAMGEKRNTEKMYLERDIKYLEDIEKQLFPRIYEENIDKNSGRGFIETMKQGDTIENNSGNNLSNEKTLVKVNSNSNSYSLYSDAA